ncbi:MAG: flagellar hook-associated protein FlgL [Oscillospiraceae bacterium]|nr:flagellar hook-associated protein FlgL [Oscillospiraceae bacterium]
MRITNNMLTRNYLRGMNKNLSNLTKSNDKLSSQRSFSKASENVADANRALRIRRLLTDNERNQSTIEDTRNRFAAAEDSLRTLNTVIQNVTDKVTQGMSGTVNAEDREIISREITNLQEEVLTLSNAKFGDKYLFASAGNEKNTAPFTVNDTGKLIYNGNATAVDDMVENANGKPATDNGDGTTTDISYNGTNYLDIGLGFETANGKVDTRTAIKSTLSGAEIFGFGTDAAGNPKNLHSLLGKISQDIKEGNTETLATDLSSLKKAHTNLLLHITDIGNTTSFADQIKTTLENDEVNLKASQTSIEGVDLSEEIMYNKNFEMAWTVTLQLGSKILPQSIFDFLR